MSERLVAVSNEVTIVHRLCDVFVDNSFVNRLRVDYVEYPFEVGEILAMDVRSYTLNMYPRKSRKKPEDYEDLSKHQAQDTCITTEQVLVAIQVSER